MFYYERGGCILKYYRIHDSEYYNNNIRCTDRWFWCGRSCQGSAPGVAERIDAAGMFLNNK